MLLLYGIVSFFISLGYLFYNIINELSGKTYMYEYKSSDFVRFQFCKPIKKGYFDPFSIRIGRKTNRALEEIFDTVLKQYIFFWYDSLSGEHVDNDFIMQIKIQMQYLCARLVQRIKSVDITKFMVKKVIPEIHAHIEHIMPFISTDDVIDSDKAESVLRSLRAHLHTSMVCRDMEVQYLRAVAKLLLAYIELPPLITQFGDYSLSSSSAVNISNSTINQIGRTSSIRREASRSSSQSDKNHLEPYRAVNNLLVEVLATCVLMPAMDAIALPDVFNKLCLLCLEDDDVSESDISLETSLDNTLHVPVLSNYLDDWKTWLAAKPLHDLKFNQPYYAEDHSFVHYMKSIQSGVPIMVAILMDDVKRKMMDDVVDSEICRLVCVQLRDILIHIYGESSDQTLRDTAFTVDSYNVAGMLERSYQSAASDNERLFDLSPDFEAHLIKMLQHPSDPIKLRNFVLCDPVWMEAHQRIIDTIEQRFLPMYLEDPIYLTQMTNTTDSNSNNTSPSNNSVSRSLSSSWDAGTNKVAFSNKSVEYQQQQIVTKANRATSQKLPEQTTVSTSDRKTVTMSNGGTCVSPAVSGGGIPDLSNWHVLITGLSRPVVKASLLDRMDMWTNQHIDAQLVKLSSEYRFTVRTECAAQNGTRELVERVDRKYSEFYALEQQLIAFHKNSITRFLPRQRFHRDRDFLESKRDEFQGYLQYLVSEPFLRYSESLYNFFTSDQEFEAMLPFMQLVKSMPLNMTKETGQCLDDFLNNFKSSCDEHAISTIPVDENDRLVVLNGRQMTLTNPIRPGKGVGTVGGADVLSVSESTIVPDFYSHRRTSSDRARLLQQETTQRGNLNGRSPTTTVANQKRKNNHTMLHHRLHSRVFWNNAGLSIIDEGERQKMQSMQYAQTVDDPIGLFNYLFQRITVTTDLEGTAPMANAAAITAVTIDSTVADESTLNTQKVFHASPSLPTLFDHSSLIPVDTYAISVNSLDFNNALWNEALLTGPPPVPPSLEMDCLQEMKCTLTNPNLVLAVDHHPSTLDQSDQVSSINSEYSLVQDSTNLPNDLVSISWQDLINALQCTVQLCATLIRIQLRRFVVCLINFCGNRFNGHLNILLISRLSSYFRSVMTDCQLASILDALRDAIFSSDATHLISEREKLDRRHRASRLLSDTLLDLGFTYLADPDLIRHSVDRVFNCFQQAKWNKQLSYVLLDHLLVELFPELNQIPSESSV